MNSYTHLTVFHRQTIGKLKKQGKSLRFIARILGVSPSTISREVRRNYCGFGYCCYIADDRAKSRRWAANQQHRKLDLKACYFVAQKMKEHHSPEQIASQFPEELQRTICHQTLYRFIHSYQGYRLNVRRFLRRKNKRYISKKHRQAVVTNKPSIDTRPPEVHARTSFGHWEADLMEGPRAQSGALLVLVERKSRFTLTRFISAKKSRLVSKAIISMLQPYEAETITFDNGTEFAAYKTVSKETGAASYFCHPYHSWEKGTVENTIGLLREYYPKKTLIPSLPFTHAAIRKQLNQRPRKTLGFATPQSLVDNFKKTN